MTTNNNLDALSQDAELPFGHPGRRCDDTPEGFSQSPLMDQGPERDYTPDEYGRVIHYGPGDRPLCGSESMTAAYTDDPAPWWSAAPTAWNWLPRTSTRTTSTGRTASTVSRRSPPRAGWSGAEPSVGPARTAGSPDGNDQQGLR